MRRIVASLCCLALVSIVASWAIDQRARGNPIRLVVITEGSMPYISGGLIDEAPTYGHDGFAGDHFVCGNQPRLFRNVPGVAVDIYPIGVISHWSGTKFRGLWIRAS